jgi:hypothetical protein
MSLRSIVLIAASVIIGIACIATVSTDTFARAAGVTRLDHSRHHHRTVHHSGQAQVRHGSTGNAARATR